jgi:alanyl-tRNA synthetase
MQKTEKFYLNDVTNIRCEAKLIWSGLWRGKPALVFERTIFYGEGGGQYADQGTLTLDDSWSLRVHDVQIEDGVYYHLIEELPSNLPAGGTWIMDVDRDHRRDSMSQHTGQHLVSAVFAHEHALKTISSHLGSVENTIDIPVKEPDWELLDRVETKVNELVMEDRPVIIHYPDEKELAGMPLRRTPKVKENIRVVEILDYDFTPCGGTHCLTTGEVGSVRILGQERYKGMLRVRFIAGKRVVALAQKLAGEARFIVKQTECQLKEIPNLVEGLKNQLAQTQQEMGIYRKVYLEQYAAQLLDKPFELKRAVRFIAVEDDSLDSPSRRLLSGLLVQKEKVVTVILSGGQKKGKKMILLSRNADLELDLAVTFRTVFGPRGGRGGGKPHHVEGFLPEEADTASILKELEQHMETLIQKG